MDFLSPAKHGNRTLYLICVKTFNEDYGVYRVYAMWARVINGDLRDSHSAPLGQKDTLNTKMQATNIYNDRKWNGVWNLIGNAGSVFFSLIKSAYHVAVKVSCCSLVSGTNDVFS